MPELAGLSLREAVAGLEAAEFTALDLLESCLGRAEREIASGAFVVIAETAARRDAQREPGGILRGAPVAIKDVLDVAGLPTRAGSAATSPRPAGRDADVVHGLREAGAVVLGKTATHELAYGVQTPAVVNPADPELTAGGSSGGSAVAVAVGAVPLAVGTDTAGSVRIPAICCGVHGLMARPGRLSPAGMVPLAPSFDTFGVLVREPSDLRLAYEALTGGPAGPTPPAGRILVLSETALDADRVEQAARAGASEVASALADRVDVVDLPPFSGWARPRARVIGAEALRTHGELGLLESSEPLGDDIVALHAQADALPAASVRSARADLRDLADGLLAAIGPDDVLVTPVLPGPPPARTMSPAVAATTLTRMVAPANAAGLAAAALSLGSQAGVQLIARSASTLLTVLDRLPTGAAAAR